MTPLFLFDVLLAKQRIQHQVRQHIEGEGQMLVEHLGVEANQFLAGESVQTAADGID